MIFLILQVDYAGVSNYIDQCSEIKRLGTSLRENAVF